MKIFVIFPFSMKLSRFYFLNLKTASLIFLQFFNKKYWTVYHLQCISWSTKIRISIFFQFFEKKTIGKTTKITTTTTCRQNNKSFKIFIQSQFQICLPCYRRLVVWFAWQERKSARLLPERRRFFFWNLPLSKPRRL